MPDIRTRWLRIVPLALMPTTMPEGGCFCPVGMHAP